MKKNYRIIIFLLFVGFAAYTCTKKIIPGLDRARQSGSYDEATFNYNYVEAIKQKILGNYGDALEYLEQCLKVNPESGAAYYQMAQIVVANGDLNNGKKYAAKALYLEPGNLWYIMMLAGIYYQDRDLDSAIIYYEKAVKNYPEKVNLKLNLGNLYSENKNFDKARIIFSSLDEKYGVNESSTISLIRSLIVEKKYKEAHIKILELLKQNPDELLFNSLLAEIYRGEGENEKAFEVYNQLINRNPDNPQTQLSLCDFLITEKKYDDLLMLLNTVTLNNKISRDDKISLFTRLFEIQDIVENHGADLEIALMILEANFKNDDVVILLRPELLQKANKLQEATQRLNEIIEMRPENYFAWEKLLLVYYDLRDFQKLMERGKECATKFNRSFLAKILYANGALENKSYAIALEELRKASILAGNNKEMLLQVLTMQADVYYRMKDFKRSFEIFEEALKANGEDLTVLNNYAYYLAEQNIKLREAEEMAKKVIEKEKDNNTFLDTYAWVLYKKRRLKAAANVMEKIINSNDKPDAEWYEHYGYILKKRRNCREAIIKWETALKLDSTKTGLKEEIKSCKSSH